MSLKSVRNAFTLIELLIVVAIIAILAAIAVPNFLEAQTRSKVSRVKADIRTMATALEAYITDVNSYPLCHSFGTAMAPGQFNVGPRNGVRVLENLSTPVAYVTSSIMKDPFKISARCLNSTSVGQSTEVPSAVSPATDAVAYFNSYIYQAWNGEQRYTTDIDGFSDNSKSIKPTAWLLHSAGPDGVYHNMGGILANDVSPAGPILLIYDATNGTVSFGSIFRTNGANPGSIPGYAAGSGLMRALASSGQ